mgnify:CR=1 FL=1
MTRSHNSFGFYRRQRKSRAAVPEGATTFEPALIVKATDTDGPSQGGGQVFYSIKSVNTDATVFGIDSVTGQITIVQPVRSDQVEKGLYSLVVRATDAGTPPLHSDVKVTVTAGSTGNQKPVFGQQNYQAKGRHLTFNQKVPSLSLSKWRTLTLLKI